MDSLRFFGDWRTGPIIFAVQDIHMLSISDFLVCTFSSQVNQQNCKISKVDFQTKCYGSGVQNCI